MHFVRRYILFRRYKTNSLSFFKRFLRLSFFMSYFIRAAQRFLSVALSFVLAFYPFSVQAAEIKAAQGSVAPTVYQAPNGVAMVDIVAPNSAGVSHNKYEQFNIGPSGVILNNSTAEVSQSRLGGLIGGNRNLNNNETARIILNEVTSSNRSLLQGAAEIHGRSAEFILANPYGITCNGCGFINTPQVTLTSGVPQFNADGSLHGFNVRGGDILFGERGAYLSEADVFNIVTHRVRIDGPLYVGEGSLDIATGPMAWAYNTGLITPYESQTGEDVPSYAIDSSLLGGMYAGRIRLISTQAGAGVRLRGDVASTTDGMMLSADGKLVLNRVQSQKGLDVASHASSVEFHDVAYAQEDVAVDAQTDITLGQAAILASQADVSLDAGSDVRLADGSLIVSGMAADGGRDAQSDIAISATQLESTGTGQVDAADELHITAQKIDISRSADAADGGDGLSSRGDMVLEVNQIEANNNRILSYRDIRLSGLGDIKLVSGTMIAGGDMQITSDASLDNAMSLLAYNALSVETGTVTNTGAIASYGGLSLGSGDAVLNGFENSGQLYAYDSDITIDASDFTNAGGELRSIGTGDITVDAERFTNNSGTVSAAGDLTLTGGEFSNIVDDANSLILSGGDMALSFAGDVFSNAGYLVSSGGFTLIQAGDVTNSGVIQAQGDIGFGSDAAYLSGFSQSGMIKSIDGGVSVYADGFVGDAESQLIAAGDVAISVLGDVDNNGALASFEGDIGFTGAGSWTGDGLIQAGAGGIDINGFDSFGGAARLVGHGDVVIAVNGALSLAEGGFIATQNIVDEAGESILSGEVNLSGNVLSIAGQLTAQGGGVGLTALDGLSLSTTSSVFAASGLDIISGGDFATAGSVQSQGGLSIASSGNITQSGTLISLASDTALSLEAGLLSNTGAIASYGGLSLGSGDTALSGFDNSGQLYAYDSDVDIHASGFTNAGGELRSIGTGDITVDADSFTNNAGTVSAAGDLTLTGREFSNIVDDANSLILSGGNMALSYAGDVFSNAGYLVSSGGFALTQAGDVTNSGVIQAQGDIGFGSDAAYLSGFSQSGMVKSIDGGVSVYAAGFVSDAESQLIGAGDVAISVLGDVDNNGALASFDGDIGFTGAGSWTGDGLIQAVAGGIDINGFDSFGGAARLVGHGDVVIAVNGALSLAEGGFIATQNIVDEAGESILSGGVNLSGEALSIAGQLTAQGGGVGLTASDDLSIFDTSSVFAASGLDIISGGDFATAGRVQSQGGLSIASSGNITQSGTLISLASDSVLSLEAGSLSNTGATASYGGLSLGSGDAVLNGFENSGQLYAYDSDITIDASDFTNAGGELRSIGTGDITVDADSFTNNAGTVSAAGDLTLTGGEFSNIVDDANSLILSGGDMALSFAGDVFSNAGYLVSSGGFTLTQAGDVTNSGIIQAQGDIGFGSDAAYLSGFSQSGMIKSIDGGVSVYADGFVSDAESQLIGTGDVAISVLGDVDNNGALASFDGDIGFTGAGSWTGDGLIQAVAGGIDINGFDSFGGAARLVGHGDVEVAVDGALSLDAGGFIATQNIVDAAGDTIVSGGVTLSGEVLSIAGQLTAQGGGVGLTASDDLSIFDTSSVFAASGLDIISGGDFATAGRVQSQGGLSIASSGNITQSGTVLSYASDSVLSLEAGSLSNTGAIASYGGLSLGSGDAVLNGFENSGQLYAYDSDITIDASDFTNAGGELRSIISTSDISDVDMPDVTIANIIINADSFTNNSGTVSAAGDLTLTGGEFSNIVDDANSLILSGGDMALSFAGDVFSNAGYLVSSGGFTLTQAGDVTNSGIIQAQGDIGFGSDAAYLSGFSQSGMIKSIDGGVSVYADGFVSDAESQLIAAGDVAVSVTDTGNVTQDGTFISQQGDIGFTGAGSWTGDGLIQAVAGGIDINGFDSFGGAARLVGHSDVVIAVDGALTLAEGGFIATQNIVDDATGAVLSSSGGVNLSGEVLSIAGQLTAQGGGVGLTASDDLSIFDTSSVFAASGLDIISGGDFATAGRVQSQGGLSIASSGNITQSGTLISLASDTALSLTTTGRFSNTGAIASYGGLSLGSGDAVLNGFENSGQLYAYDSDITIDASDFTNAGGELRSIISTSDISDADMPDVTIANIIINADSFTNNAGTVSAAGDLTLTGKSLYNYGGYAVDNMPDNRGLIYAGGTLDVNLSSNLINKSYIINENNLSLNLGGAYENYAKIQSGGVLTLQGKGDSYHGGLYTKAGSVLNGIGGLTIKAAGLVNHGAVLSSAGDMHFYLKNGNAGSATLRNYGAVQSAGSSHFYLEDEFFNSQGSIFAGQNITVEKITNQDTESGASVIHGGKINALLNSSGTIEAGGNIDIYANNITNKRTQFSVTKTSKTLEGKTEIYDEKTSHYETSVCLNASTIYCVYSKINEDIYWRTVTEVGESLKANYTSEAIIKAGVDLSLNATNTLENKQSSLYAGGTVSITSNSFINQGERVENYTISNYVRENKVTESKHTFCFVGCGDEQKIKDSGWSWSKTSTSTEDLGSTKNVTRTSQEFEARVRGGAEVNINLTGNLDNKEMGFITSGHIVRVTTNDNITNEGVFWSDGAAYLHLDGTLTNKNGGDIIGDEELTIRGKGGGHSRADAIINQASTIETLAGGLYLYADEVVNKIGLKPVKHKKVDIEYDSNNYMTQVVFDKYYWEDDITYYREKYAINPGEAGKIISGNHLVIEAGHIKNDHSALSAGWQLRANVAIEQSGTELQEWSRTYSKRYMQKCGMSLRNFSTSCGSKKYVGTTSSSTPKVSTADSTTAIISAKNVIIGQDNKSGTIHSVTGSNINMEVVTPEGIEPLNVTTDTKSIDKSDTSIDIAGDTDGSIPDTDVDETMFEDGVDIDSEDPSIDISGDDSASALDIDTATDTPSVNADELVGAADDITGDSEAAYIDNQTLVSDDYDIDSADMAADDMEVPEPPVFVPPAQNGLFTDIDIPTNNEPAPPGKAVSLSTLTNSIDALSRRSLFKTRPEGDTPYQIETRIEFLDASTYYGSDYFIEKYNHDGNESLRRLGDSFAETRLIRAQVQELTGRHSVSADSANEQAMIKTLYDNAYAAQQSLELTPGVSLSAEQVAALQEDIIWLEKQQVNGEEVLVPRVYLADARALGFATSIYGQENVSITADSYTTTSSDSLVSDGNMFITTVEEFTHEGHLEVANAAVFNVGTDFTNMVDLDAAYIEVNAGGDILNDNAALTSTGGLLLTAGGMMHNLGGQISGGTVSIIAQDILNETEIDREYNGRNNYADTLGDVASISATGSMSLIAGNSITIAGAELTAGGSLLMDANTVTVTALALEEQFSGKRGGWKVNEYQKTLASSSITAGEDLSIHADQNILILGSDLTATGAVGLSTLNGDITIAAMQEVLSQTRTKTKKKSWGRRKTTTETTLDITNQMATITSGAGISLTSGKDINLKAANLNAGQDINLTTLLEEGSVNILVGKDTKQVDRTTTKSNALVEANRWSGSYDETLVYTEMQTGNGGKVNFNTENINVDYLDPTAKSSSGAQSGGGLQSFIVPLVLSENLQRQKAEGQVDDIVAANDNLSWMQDLTGDERVNWTGVEETHTSYSESSKNLTQAGALIVSIAVTAATGGLATGVAGSALSAAASSAAVLGSNAALNSGGSFNDFMDTMTDKDTLQQIATSAVTAAVTAGAADWAAGTADSVAGATSNSSTFMHQAGHYAVEVTAQSAIQAGADAILSGGDWNDMRDNFTDGFESRLVSNIASSAISRGDSLGDGLGDKVAEASNDFLGRATDVVVDSFTETAVNALVEVGKGGNLSDFGDAFQDNFEDTLLKNTAEAANEAISSEIGDSKNEGDIGTATQLGLHALTGCASAALQSGDCGTGALGQVTGEVVGMLYNEYTDMADIDSDGDGYISDSEESAWRDKGVELAGNVTQAVLTATGADAHDIAIGTTNAKTAAENNAMSHIAREVDLPLSILEDPGDAGHAATVIHRRSRGDFTPEQIAKFGEPIELGKDDDGNPRYGYVFESLSIEDSEGNERLVSVVNGKMKDDKGNLIDVPSDTANKTAHDYNIGDVMTIREHSDDAESKPYEERFMQNFILDTVEKSPDYPSLGSSVRCSLSENKCSSEALPNSNTDARILYESSGRPEVSYLDLETQSNTSQIDRYGLKKTIFDASNGGFYLPGYLPETRIPNQENKK